MLIAANYSLIQINGRLTTINAPNPRNQFNTRNSRKLIAANYSLIKINGWLTVIDVKTVRGIAIRQEICGIFSEWNVAGGGKDVENEVVK